MSKQWCIDNLKVLKNNSGKVDEKVFEETIKYLEKDIPRERIEQILSDIHKNAITLQEHGFDSVAIDAFEIMMKATIYKYTKEQNNVD